MAIATRRNANKLYDSSPWTFHDRQHRDSLPPIEDTNNSAVAIRFVEINLAKGAITRLLFEGFSSLTQVLAHRDAWWFNVSSATIAVTERCKLNG